MARLQDFQTVSPASTDNIIIVQPTGQGLATVGSTIGNKAPKTDLASISITGSTNNTGSTIGAGTFFYLNGSLVRAKTNIANGATLTVNTNYETVTAGGLNRLYSVVDTLKQTKAWVLVGTKTAKNDPISFSSDANEIFISFKHSGGYEWVASIPVAHITGVKYIYLGSNVDNVGVFTIEISIFRTGETKVTVAKLGSSVISDGNFTLSLYQR